MAKKAPAGISKYRLYEAAVQNPDWQLGYLPRVHRELIGRNPVSMREDFCGSGKISCEWVKRSPRNRAVGLDIDPEPLAYAESVHRDALPAGARARVAFLRQDVLKPTREKFDLIGAYNYSFFIFHERRRMLQYARAAFRSLKARGTFFLELAGGEGFMEPFHDSRTLKIPGAGKVEYLWEQHQYDPISAVTDYSIHFRLPDGQWMNDAFSYNWRLWGIRELREILEDAGFRRTVVLWGELDAKGEMTGEFLPAEHAEHLKAWNAYVVGVK